MKDTKGSCVKDLLDGADLKKRGQPAMTVTTWVSDEVVDEFL